MSATLEALTSLYARVCTSEEIASKHFRALKSDLLELITEERDRLHRARTQTATLPAGLPCAAQFEAAPDVAPTEPIGHVVPVDSSQMIPPIQLNRAARGGE